MPPNTTPIVLPCTPLPHPFPTLYPHTKQAETRGSCPHTYPHVSFMRSTQLSTTYTLVHIFRLTNNQKWMAAPQRRGLPLHQETPPSRVFGTSPVYHRESRTGAPSSPAQTAYQPSRPSVPFRTSSRHGRNPSPSKDRRS